MALEAALHKQQHNHSLSRPDRMLSNLLLSEQLGSTCITARLMSQDESLVGLSVLFEVNQKSGVRHSRPRAKAPGSAVKLAGPPGESPASKAGGFTRVLFSVLLSLVAVFRKT